MSDSSPFSYLFEAFKQVVCCQPWWWFSGLHHLCPYVADTTQLCKVMDGFWNRLHKLSCCWSSEWELSWLFWGSGDGYCSTDKALAAGTGELQLFMTNSRDCDCPVWWHLTAQKDIAKLSCWKSHGEHGTDFDNFQNLYVHSLVSEILSFKNKFQRIFKVSRVLTKRRGLSWGL